MEKQKCVKKLKNKISFKSLKTEVKYYTKRKKG